MDNNHCDYAGFSFTKQQLAAVLSTPEGRQLLTLLSRDGGSALSQKRRRRARQKPCQPHAGIQRGAGAHCENQRTGMSEFSFEQAIGAMLQDPEQMQKIFALAQSLGFSPPAAQQAPPPPPEPPVSPPPTPKQEASPPDDRQQALGELLQKAGTLDRRQENLLNALKPFLKPERREKIDRAMQAARISRLAGAALRGRDQKE